MRTFGTGVALVEQGDLTESFFVLVTGGVRVVRSQLPTGEPVVLAELGVGEVIGEMGALDQQRRSASQSPVPAADRSSPPVDGGYLINRP